MRDDGARIVLIIESFFKERFIAYTILYGLGYLRQDTFCSIHENLIQMFLLTDLIEQCTQRFDSEQLVLNLERISVVEKILKVSKRDR